MELGFSGNKGDDAFNLIVYDNEIKALTFPPGLAATRNKNAATRTKIRLATYCRKET